MLLSGHCVDFDGLDVNVKKYPLGSELAMDYRIDAKEMQPVTGTLRVPVSPEAEWGMEDICEDDHEFDAGRSFWPDASPEFCSP